MDEPGNPYDPSIYAERIDDPGGPGASAAIKIELGGADKPKRDGFTRIDLAGNTDVRHDLDAPGLRLPIDDDSVMQVSLRHRFESPKTMRNVLHEIARVCQIGAYVEIRIPHWLSNVAVSRLATQAIPPALTDQDDARESNLFWEHSPRRLRLFHIEYGRGLAFEEWKQLLPDATDEQIMRLCPEACQEIQYVFHAVSNQ